MKEFGVRFMSILTREGKMVKIKENRAIFYKKPLLMKLYDKYGIYVLLISFFLTLVSKIWSNFFRIAI